MVKKLSLIAVWLLLAGCKGDTSANPAKENSDFISAVDISSFPEISASNPVFYALDGNKRDFLEILKQNGVNTIRLRLWVNPESRHSGFEEVKQFSEILKIKGFKIWLTMHYSDTWADPGQQITPKAWQGLVFEGLRDSVRSYTQRVVQQIRPDYIQTGNEINPGFLHPYGNIETNFQNFITLLNTGSKAVRDNSPNTKIIIHFAGIEGSNWFFNQIKNVDYDFIGLSYYPIWHGKSLESLKTTLNSLAQSHQKEVLVAETAYPFTLEWNDWANNVVGEDSQLILPQFPASAEGQKGFVRNIKNIVKESKNGVGFCYWGAELIAWKGSESTSGSAWENQALFDFENIATPALLEFSAD